MFSVNNLFAQLFKLLLPRRIHLLLAGYVSQEDFQSSTGFPLWLWPASGVRICVCDGVCVNVPPRRWAGCSGVSSPSSAGVPRDCPWHLFASHSAGVLDTGQGASNGLQPHCLNLISPLACSSLKWKLIFPSGVFPKSRNEQNNTASLHCSMPACEKKRS